MNALLVHSKTNSTIFFWKRHMTGIHKSATIRVDQSCGQIFPPFDRRQLEHLQFGANKKRDIHRWNLFCRATTLVLHPDGVLGDCYSAVRLLTIYWWLIHLWWQYLFFTRMINHLLCDRLLRVSKTPCNIETSDAFYAKWLEIFEFWTWSICNLDRVPTLVSQKKIIFL